MRVERVEERSEEFMGERMACKFGGDFDRYAYLSDGFSIIEKLYDRHCQKGRHMDSVYCNQNDEASCRVLN